MKRIRHIRQMKDLSVVQKAILYVVALNHEDGVPTWLIDLEVDLMLSAHLGIDKDKWESYDRALLQQLDNHAEDLYVHLTRKGA